MMNINCSFNCSHERNGKCTLNHVTPVSCFSIQNVDCAYYEPKMSSNKYGAVSK